MFKKTLFLFDWWADPKPEGDFRFDSESQLGRIMLQEPKVHWLNELYIIPYFWDPIWWCISKFGMFIKSFLVAIFSFLRVYIPIILKLFWRSRLLFIDLWVLFEDFIIELVIFYRPHILKDTFLVLENTLEDLFEDKSELDILKNAFNFWVNLLSWYIDCFIYIEEEIVLVSIDTILNFFYLELLEDAFFKKYVITLVWLVDISLELTDLIIENIFLIWWTFLVWHVILIYTIYALHLVYHYLFWEYVYLWYNMLLDYWYGEYADEEFRDYALRKYRRHMRIILEFLGVSLEKFTVTEDPFYSMVETFTLHPRSSIIDKHYTTYYKLNDLGELEMRFKFRYEFWIHHTNRLARPYYCEFWTNDRWVLKKFLDLFRSDDNQFLMIFDYFVRWPFNLEKVKYYFKFLFILYVLNLITYIIRHLYLSYKGKWKSLLFYSYYYTLYIYIFFFFFFSFLVVYFEVYTFFDPEWLFGFDGTEDEDDYFFLDIEDPYNEYFEWPENKEIWW